MLSSKELSLDENVVFLPVDESSTGFLHCEREREAVEELLSAGPEAFYSAIGPERFGCFLSPQEVGQMTQWVQSWVQPEEEDGVERSTLMEDYCSTYFPEPFDFPAPNLDLGWPEDQPCGKNSLMVYSSLVEGQPPVRQIIRTHLQEAKKVIAIVTDSLTDNTVISDLHMAASRGVPVYIILNKRSAQENLTLSRMQHPNMRVRVLGGKTFYSRTGRKVVGELKEKFLLVDLETVILGSYSLTWTDAHLHRQLIMVLTGSTVDWFDTEFRTLYADSLPAPYALMLPGNLVLHVPDELKNSMQPRFQRRLSVELDIPTIPSPAKDILLDWKDMGFYQEIHSSQDNLLDLHEESLSQQTSQQKDNKDESFLERIAYHRHHFEDVKRVQKSISPKTVGETKDLPPFTNTEPSFTQTADAKRLERLDHKIEKALCRQGYKEKNLYLHNGSTEPDDETLETYKGSQQILRRHSGLEKRNTSLAFSRRSLILDEPKSECHRYTNYILKTIMQGTEGILRRKCDPLLSEKPQYMLDPGGLNTDWNSTKTGGPVPRIQGGFVTDQMTPASILIKERNQETRAMTPKVSYLMRASDERKDL